MSEENATPRLDAATLPIGTVMMLGGNSWKLMRAKLQLHQFMLVDESVFWSLRTSELQELID